MKKLHIKVHEAWLAILMSSFMAKKSENKRVLDQFSDILWRHFCWIENLLIKENIDYNYNRDTVPIKVDKLSQILSDIVRRINEIELLLIEIDDDALKERIKSDLDYIKFALGNLEDEEVKAFSMSRKYKNLDLGKEATDSLTLFLFEESYKEYELIMIYNYLKAHSNDAFLIRIFQILIDESFFHLKSFCEMMSEMGILGVPRTIHESLYKNIAVEKFLIDGIDEEIAAKEQCKELSDAVAKESEELSKFFDFINNQENYHIALMQDAVSHYQKEHSNA